MENENCSPQAPEHALEPSFRPILTLIRRSQRQALQAVNAALVDLYWRIGEYLSGKIITEAWGQKTVEELALWLQAREPGLRGFSASTLWRARQFFEIYEADKKLAPLVRELNLGQLSFYLEALDRQHRKPHEKPSIGVLLCKGRNADVVEFSLGRTLSPALVADYETQLPDKALLRAKMEEFYALMERDPVTEPPACS